MFGCGGRGPSARAGWGAARMRRRPRGPRPPAAPCRRRAGKDGAAVGDVGNVLVCVFNSSGVLILLGVCAKNRNVRKMLGLAISDAVATGGGRSGCK